MVSLLPGVLLRRVRVADGPGWTLTQSIETLQLLQQTRLENRTGLSPSELALRLRFDPAELEVAVRLLMDLGWVARLDGEDRLVLLIETEQTPAAPLLVQTLLAPSEATQALWQTWQGITLADLLAHAHQARPS